MKCLILAAGRGSRLSKLGDVKPLCRLYGVPLMERSILTAKQAGLDDFYVVTGYKGELLKQFLEDLSVRCHLRITTLHNDDWEKGNGLSVLKAQSKITDNFLLLMVDHIIEETILTRLLSQKLGEGEVILAVDYKTKNNTCIDPDDVTKVLAENHSIRDIGKDLTRYNAYDTGAFFCTPAIFQSIRESCQQGDSSLSGGIKILANSVKARVIDVGQSYWIDIDTPTNAKNAKKMLLNSLVKPQDGFIAESINRKCSLYLLTPLLVNTCKGITPNQVSTLSFVIGLLAASCYFAGGAVAGGFLIQLSSILDGCDGEIARLKKMQSGYGNFFDAVLDRYTDTFVLFGILFYALTSLSPESGITGPWMTPLVITAMLAITGNLMVSYTTAKAAVDLGHRYKGKLIAAGRGRDLRVFILFVGSLLTLVHPVSAFFTLLVIAVLTNAIVLRRVYLSWLHTKAQQPLLPNKIKAVIFDFDGTIADTMPFLTEIAVKLLTQHHDISQEEAQKRYIQTSGLPFEEQMELIFPNHPKNYEVTSIFETRKLAGISQCTVFGDALPTLEYFKKMNLLTFVCSSSKKDVVDDFLKRNQLMAWVDEAAGYGPNLGKAKQIERFLERYQLSADQVLFVGDSLRDSLLSQDMKIAFVGVTRLLTAREFETRGLPCVPDLEGLVEWFDRSLELENALGTPAPRGTER